MKKINTAIKILIAEHDIHDLAMIDNELKKGGIDFVSEIVQNEASYRKALKIFIPDIILCDYRFPSFDGPTAFKIKEQLAPETPFILVSGAIGEEYSIELIKNGVTDFVLKDRIFTLTTKLLRGLKEANERKEKNKIEQDFKQTAAHLAEAQSLAKLGSWDYDIAVDKLTWSKQLYKVFDTDTEAFTETYGSFLHLIDETDRNKAEQTSRHTKETGDRFILEYGITTPKGEKRIIQEHGYGVKDAAGKVIRLFGTAQDITERKKAENAVKESETRYRAFFENSMDGLLLTVTDGNILAANPAACKIFDMTEQEICDAGRFGLVDLSDPRVENLIKERQLTGKAQGELTLLRKDRTTFAGEMSSVKYTDSFGKERTSMIIRDISERKETEERLALTSGKLQSALNDITRIMDSSLDVICAVDAKGNFLKVSAASEAVWGYKPEELIGKPLINFVYHEDNEKTQLTAADVMTGNSLYHFENRYVRKDGALVPIEWSARWDKKDQIRYGIARDVTEKKRLQKAFEIERQQFFDLFSEAPSSMGVLSGPDHRFEMANPLYLQLIGKKDIIGKYVKDVLPEIAKQGFIDILDSVYRTGKTFSANEMLIKLDVNNTGKPVDKYLNFIYQPHLGSDGKPDGILFFAVDVSEQVLSRKKIEESEARLKEAQALLHISNWEIDLTTGVQTWSDEFYNICGIKPGDIEPSPEAFLSFIHPEDAAYVKEAIQKTYETFAASHFSFRLLTSDGITKYVYSEWRFELDENDNPIRLYGVLQDITERILAKEKLELTQFTFDHAGDAIFWMASDARIVDVNEAACHSLGYTRQELLRLSVPDIDPDFNVETWSAFFTELREKHPLFIETTQLRKDGSLLPVEIISNYIQYGNRELSCAFVRDISKRKLTEEALLKSREEYKSFFEEDLTGDYITTVEGKLLNCNPAFLKICGFTSKEEALNYDMRKLYANEGGINEMIEKLKEKKMLTLFEADLKRPDGKIINVVANIIGEFDSKGNLKTFKGYIFDETTRKAAMTELRKLSVAVEQSTATVLITDIKGNIEYVNKKFTEITGYSQKEVIGKNPRIFKSGRQSKEVYEQLWQNITSGKDWYGELLNKKKDGSLYWEQASISPIIDENGKITHFLGVQEDITEKKENEIKLIKALEKSEESDKLKTAFLHNISHEIRTPMNAIIGFSNFLKEPELSFEKKNKYTDIVIKSSEQLLAIITDIIHIATIETGQEKISEKEIKLNSLLKLVYEQFKEKILAKNIDFNLQLALPNEEDDMITDETKLMEIITNLVGNALKFTSKGFINMGYKVKENQLEIYVEDSGIGIPANMYEEIFDRFSQVERTSTRFFGGSGLGLSISKGYAELLGGKMSLQSVLGKGAIFYVTIPFKKVLKKDLNENVNTTKEIILEATKTILVAEDEDYNFMLIEELLSYSNMKILRAENGKEAIDLFKSNPQIDLVLMDIKMPVMNGIEATKEIRKFAPNLPIIAQTAFSTTVDKQFIKEAGCNDIIIKPFNSEDLMAKISKFLGKAKS